MVEESRAELLDRVATEFRWAASLADPARLADWEEEGLTMAQLRILFNIRLDPGLTFGTLADRLGVRASTVTGIVDRLAEQNLMERGGDVDDRRLVRAFLTPSGEHLINEYSTAASAYIRAFLEPLPAEELREALIGLGIINGSAQRLGLQPEREIPGLATR